MPGLKKLDAFRPYGIVSLTCLFLLTQVIQRSSIALTSHWNQGEIMILKKAESHGKYHDHDDHDSHVGLKSLERIRISISSQVNLKCEISVNFFQKCDKINLCKLTRSVAMMFLPNSSSIRKKKVSFRHDDVDHGLGGGATIACIYSSQWLTCAF